MWRREAEGGRFEEGWGAEPELMQEDYWLWTCLLNRRWRRTHARANYRWHSKLVFQVFFFFFCIASYIYRVHEFWWDFLVCVEKSPQPATLHQAGQRAQHTTDWAIPAPFFKFDLTQDLDDSQTQKREREQRWKRKRGWASYSVETKGEDRCTWNERTAHPHPLRNEGRRRRDREPLTPASKIG